MAESERRERGDDVDRVLQDWRQGDCTLNEQWFVHRLDPAFPVTQAAICAASEGADLAEHQELGLVVLTQTCDIVRGFRERPYLEVCPLIRVDENWLHDIERGRRIAYAFVPCLADQYLVADLDRIMTIEKPLVLNWKRTQGCSSDAEARAFAQALSRKRVRFAFPDDFTELVRNLGKRLVDKHQKNTQEGRALRALREIRIQAAPSWNESIVELMFFFIRGDESADFEAQSWDGFLAAWLKLVPASGRFVTIHGQVSTLDELTAADYVYSDALDLDHLTPSAASPQASGAQ